MLSTWSSQNSSITSRRVHAEQPEQPGHLVGERHLRRVERVARVLERLGDPHCRSTCSGLAEEAEQAGDRVSATAGSAVPITMNGGSKKSAMPEPSRRNSGHIAAPYPMPVCRRAAGQRRQHHVLDRARRDGAADHHGVPPGAGGRGAQRRCDIVHGPADDRPGRCRRARSTGCRRRPATGRPRRARRGRTSSRAACRRGHRLADEVVQARLGHRAAAGTDLIDLGRVDVNAPDVDGRWRPGRQR